MNTCIINTTSPGPLDWAAAEAAANDALRATIAWTTREELLESYGEHPDGKRIEQLRQWRQKAVADSANDTFASIEKMVQVIEWYNALLRENG